MNSLMLADEDLIVDLFAGGGGASLGTRWAFGRDPDIAVNHDSEAIAMHMANHPGTTHYTEDVRKVDILKVTAGRAVGFLWLSPDCKHHSKAKGGKPVDRKIRGLAWEAVRWAVTLPKDRRPKVMVLENVEEFRDWGPVSKTTKRPDPLQKGFTYRRFKRELEKLGYKVQDRMLRACDFGAPTTRHRLFLIARCDGKPIVWPKPTHSKTGAGGLTPWRTAAECIDFSIPCPSIFLSKEQAKEMGYNVKRPLAEKSERRIYRGIDKFVINNPRPFIVPMYHSNAPKGVDDPLQTITTQGNKFNLVAPSIAKFRFDSPGSAIDAPMPTITAGPKKNPAGAAHALGLVAPTIVSMYGASVGRDVEQPAPTLTAENKASLIAPTIIPVTHAGDLRTHSVEEPLRTITAANRGEQALVSSVLAGVGGRKGQSAETPVDKPFHTITTKADTVLVAPVMVPRYGEREGQAPRARSIEEPAATVVPTANGDSLVAAHMVKNFDGNYKGPGGQVEMPLGTITTRDHNAVASSHLMKLKGTCRDGQPVDAPIHTIQAGGWHYAEVRAFLTKYHGSGGQWNSLLDPAPTVVANDSFGLVYVEGVPHAIVDIGMRMLMARELFRCQGFPDDYIIDPVCERKLRGKKVMSRLPADAQVRMCGNSVPPWFVKAIATALYTGQEDEYELALEKRA